MAKKKYKTSETQRRLVKEYESTKDRINVLFPAGTIDRMRNLGISDRNKSTFIKYAVEQMLVEMESAGGEEAAQKVEIESAGNEEAVRQSTYNRMLAYKKFADQMAANKRQGRKKKEAESEKKEESEE